MKLRTLRSALLARVGRLRGEDRGSLPLLFLVIIVSAALGGAMMATFLSSAHVTTFAQSRVRELDAAQTGIDVAVGHLRSAVSSTSPTIGDSDRLPCGPWSGSADDGGSGSYAVRVAYYSADPATLGNDQLTDPALGKLMKCYGAGPINVVTSVHTPKYALITSTGTGPTGNGASPDRTLQTTYNFQVLDQNIPGGQIRLYPASSTQPTQWCMDVGSNPAVGTAVTLQACSQSNPPAARQVWAYRPDLSIELVESVSNPDAAGLCLDTGSDPRQHRSGDPMVLERCAVADSQVCPPGMSPAEYQQEHPGDSCAVSPWHQQWSVDNNAHLEGAKTDQSDIDGMCINAASQTPPGGVALTLEGCQGGTQDQHQTWIPSPTAGAGMASASNDQLVNFEQFAMCLDDTGQNVGAGYMILYTCKQNPNPDRVAFNQKFASVPKVAGGPTAALLTVTTGGNIYCLKSPQHVGAYPTLVRQGGGCPSSVASAGSNSPYVWTISQRYADSSNSTPLPYANQYTIKDSSQTPLCLAPGAPNSGTPQYSTAVVDNCDGSRAQKWNASATLSGATLTNTSELLNGETATSGG